MSVRSTVACFAAAAVLVPAAIFAADTPASAAPASTAAEAPKLKPGCEQLTGTRVKPRPKEPCLGSASPLKRFSEEDIQNTGEMNISEALRKLDPNFR